MSSKLYEIEYRGLRKVISGGQTGADFAGVHAAKIEGIQTGGWVPKGWRTARGSNPALKSYGMIEHSSGDYPPRTKMNVISSDVTIRLASNFKTAGEVLTLNLAQAHNKPILDIKLDGAEHSSKASSLVDFIIKYQAQVLNVAGNSDKGDSTFHFDEAIKILTLAFWQLDSLNLLIKESNTSDSYPHFLVNSSE